MSAPEPTPVLLDIARVANLRNGLPAGVFGTLAEQCLDDISARLPELWQVLATDDGTAIAREAHAVAGMAGSYGLAAFERRMRDIMAAARAGELAAARNVAAGISGEFEQSAAMLRGLLEAEAT